MSKQDAFINAIAPYVVKWRDTFGWGVASAIIGQACLESAYGTSSKAGHQNYYGLKYKPNRVTCNSGTFTESSKEQRPDGSYYSIVTEWYEFANMDLGCEGYFQFIQTGGYANARVQTTPRGYLQALKDAGYATSINYVDNVMKVVDTYNLTKYDGGNTMYTNSPLASAAIISPNKNSPRNHAIDTITIHHMGCFPSPSAKDQAKRFQQKSRQASANYCIGNDGDIVLCVEEKDRSWCSSSASNDNRAITIEVANSSGAPNWEISPLAMQSLLNLCTDICKRNNIKALLWQDNKKLIGKIDQQNMTIHQWFAATACPGPFLHSMMGAIAFCVNQQLATPAGYILNGYDYSPVFDPVYYADRYADLKAAFGNDAAALWLHFQQFGMNEFRQGSAQFDPVYYRNTYPDLVAAFGDDRPMYYWHYVAFGINEGRKGVA